MYIIQIKNFFKQINIKKRYEKQILNHNIKKFSFMIKTNLNIFFSIKILIQISQNTKFQMNLISNIKKSIKI